MIELKPITLLLGQNSSGKSTVLRSLPLISQSVRTRSNAPVLWFGEYVDFGSVHEVRSNFARDESVTMELDFGQVGIVSRYAYDPRDRVRPIRFTLAIELIEVDDRTRLKSFSLSSASDILKVSFDTRNNLQSVYVNESEYTKLFPVERFRFITSELVPQMTVRPLADSNEQGFFAPSRRVDTADREIRRVLSTQLHGRISEGTITSLARRVRYNTKSLFATMLTNMPTPLKSWKAFANDLTNDLESGVLDRLRELAFLSSLPDFLFSLERKLSTVANNMAYIGPSRATGERYYRIQELAVDQIDPQGKNLAMFLHSLSITQLRNFSDWLIDSVGYAIKVERSSGHVQIQLKSALSDKFYNLADMGYGFSQVLPIMAQIWSRLAKRGRVSHGNTIVAMEQPELHLHPAYQGRLADILAKSVRPSNDISLNKSDLTFIVETHSEALINRMGDLISQGAIDHNDVALYVFEKGIDDDVTKITPAAYDADGILKNWPIGFFAAQPL